MIEQLPFFTPVYYANKNLSLSEMSDRYFYLGGKQAKWISGNLVELREGKSRALYTALKIMSYFTLVLPLLFFSIKVFSRLSCKFQVYTPVSPAGKIQNENESTLQTPSMQEQDKFLDNRPQQPQCEPQSKTDADKAVHTNISHDSIRSPSLLSPPTRLSRESCCQEVTPDLTFVREEEGIKLPAHRSILSDYPYWRTLFRSGMEDASNIKYPIPDAFSSEDFERLLNWLYTRELKWASVPQAGDNESQVKETVSSNLDMLGSMARLADYYQVGELSKSCDKAKNRLQKFLDDASSLSAVRAYLLQKAPLASFSASLSPGLFHDVEFTMGSRTFSGNRVLLASRSLYFQTLIKSNSGKTTIEIDDSMLDLKFFETWVAHIEKGSAVSSFISASADSFSWKPWITLENVWSFLKLAQAEKNRANVVHCCRMIADKGLFDGATDEQQLLFDTLDISRPEDRLLLLADNRFKFHFLKIDPSVNSEQDLKEYLVRQGSELLAIDLKNCKWVDDDLISTIAERCPKLQSLDLSGCRNVSDASICKIAKGCPELQSLALSGYRVSDTSINKIAKGCPKLQSLTLRCCDNVSDTSINKIAERCPELQNLTLSFCTNVSDSSISKIVERCPRLQSLALSGYRVSDTSISKIAEGCPELQDLALLGCPNVSDISINKIAEKCPKLQSLNLYLCPNVSGTSISKIAEGCPELQGLALSGYRVSDTSISKIAEGCPKLQSLDLSGCDNVSDSSISKIAERCPELQSLALRDCQNVSDASISKIAEGCPKLQSLDLSNCLNVSDSSISKIAEGCPELQSLVLSFCDNVTDASISQIADGCPQLQNLDLYSCQNVISFPEKLYLGKS